MAFLEGDVPQIVEGIRRRVLRRTRAVVVTGIVPVADARLLREQVTDALRTDGIQDDDLVFADESALEQLHHLNRTRDLLLRTRRLVLLTAPDEAGLRKLLTATVDLTSAADLTFEVRGQSADPRVVLASLQERARAQTALVDLSGLLPSDVGATRLRVGDIYMDLVSPPPRTAGAMGPGETPSAPRAAAGKRLLVVGQPGAGKTTFLRMLAAEYTDTPPKDRLGIGPRTPVLVPLPAYTRALDERRATFPLLRFVSDWLEDQGTRGAGPVFESQPEEFLLLLDGLDEVRSAAVRRAVVEEVRRLPRETFVVMTSRTLVLDELTEDQLREFEVRPARSPGPEEVQSFLQRFFLARHLERSEEEARQAAKQIEGDAELRELSRNPLLLVFLALLHELEGRIPDRRSLLYGKVADVLLDRWERARARARGSGVGPRSLALGDTRRVIGALAWWMLDGGRDEVSTTELREELARIERDRGATPDQADARAEALADVLRTGSAVLTASPHGHWRFVHATLAEYFAGVEMARGGARWEQVLTDVFRADWQEVVTFCAGELGVRAEDSRLEALGRALLKKHRGGRYAANQVTLLGAVLREDPGFAQSTTRALVERFEATCFEPRYWPRSRPAVAQAFAETLTVAPHRTWGPILVERLRDRTRNPRWREDQLEVLVALPDALAAVGEDPTDTITTMIHCSIEVIAVAGWRARYEFASEPDKEAVVTEAMRVFPALRRSQVTGRWVDDFREDPLIWNLFGAAGLSGMENAVTTTTPR